MAQEEDGAWFAAKRFGYGAGPPLCWQGWVMLAGHILLVLAVALHFHDDLLKGPLATGIAALLPMPIYAAKTRGGWRWRWGKRRDD